MAKPLIVANWKCNPSTVKEAKKLFLDISRGVKRSNRTEVVICAPFVFLPEIISAKHRQGAIKLGAQDVFWQEGPFTGEVSSKMLKSIGCKYVIIGHSERRRMGERSVEIQKKLKSAIKEALVPIFCIGETLQEREEDKTVSVLYAQIREGLKGISRNQANKVIIAYEPVWAIGTGRACGYDEAMSMHLLIKKALSSFYNKKTANNIKILYGGSVKASNALGYIKDSGMDGLLIGGASLDAKEFAEILNLF